MKKTDLTKIRDQAALIETTIAVLRNNLYSVGLSGLAETLRHCQESAYTIHHLTLPTISKDTPPFIDVA
jgi:hypothetical protein